MPTSKPRITVTLTEYQHAILRRISDSGGLSMSSVISEFMVAAQPTLERMADTFQQLRQDRYEDHQRVADLLTGLHTERDRDRNDWRSPNNQRAERMEKDSRDQANQAGQGTGDFLFPTSETSDRTRLMAGSTDAIQYCASVDTVRPDSRKPRDSPWNGNQGEEINENKKNTSRKTKGRKK